MSTIRGSGLRPAVWLGVVLLALSLTVGLVLRGLRSPAPLPQGNLAQNEAFDEPIEIVNPGYVGPQACASCHAARVAEFEKTRHFRACWPAQADTMPPGFSAERGKYHSTRLDAHFEMTQTEHGFVQAVHRRGGTETDRFTSAMDLVYGSGGKADEVYFTWKGDRLFELPIGWLHPLQRWAEQSANRNDPGDWRRTTTRRCVECHNTWIAHVPGTENQYRREEFIMGVTCERCHGPGREHVAFHRQEPAATKAQAIIDPSKLVRERQMDVCGQCHSNALMPRGPAFQFRPGDALETHFRTLVAPGIENDHVADQVKYLRKSKCFQHSDTLTCTTCHNPHRASTPALATRSCMKCHQAEACKEQKRLPEAVRPQCVECHMPQHNRVAVKFHTPDDQYVFPVRPHEHRIAIYPRAAREAEWQWYRSQAGPREQQKARELKSGLIEAWLAEGQTLSQQHRLIAALGAVREAVRLDPAAPTPQARLRETLALQQKIDDGMHAAQALANGKRYAAAIDALKEVLTLDPTNAKAHGKLGTIYAVVGRQDLSAVHLQEVAKHDPDDPYGYNMLGWLAYLRNDGAAASAAFRKADAIHPYSAEINYRWGLALLLLRSWSEAEARLRHLLEIDPNHAGGCQLLGKALSEQRKSDEAVRFAQRAVRLTKSQNADVLLSLCEAYANAERWAEAAATIGTALNVAQTDNPMLVPQLRRRQAEIQSHLQPGTK